ncbi:MAG: hypothetical protein AAGH15_01360 [Myxococcota bacterium]
MLRALAAMAVLLATVSTAAAQDAEAEFQTVIVRAIERAEAGDWEAARQLFLDAHRVRPSAEAVRMAGVASYELADYVDTIRYSEQALAIETNQLTAERQQAARDLITSARRFVSELTIRLPPGVEGVDLLLDRREVPADTPVLVTRGYHELRAVGAGYQPYERELDLESETETVTLVLLPIQLEPAAETGTPTAPDPEPEARRSRTWLWVTLSVLAAGAIAAGVGVAVANGDEVSSPNVEALGTVLRTR